MGYDQKSNYLETWTSRKRITLTKPHPHSLADIITALNKLSPSDEEAINAIFGILGVSFESEVIKIDIKHQEKISELPTEKDAKNIQKESVSSSPQPEIFTESDKPALPSALVPLGKSHISFQKPLNLKNTVISRSPITSYPLQTLFIPKLTRAILASALSIYDNFGPINISEIVRLVSLNEPLREIPRLPWPTMVHGVQVLIDESKALEPFYKDQIHLSHAVRKIAGLDRTQTMGFICCPSRGVRYETFDDWSDYYPPSSRSTVLLMTDLGISRGPYIMNSAGVSEWLRFASIVRNAGCTLVAFVPYPKERWPKSLQCSMRIIQWDRATYTSTIQHIVKKPL